MFGVTEYFLYLCTRQAIKQCETKFRRGSELVAVLRLDTAKIAIFSCTAKTLHIYLWFIKQTSKNGSKQTGNQGNQGRSFQDLQMRESSWVQVGAKHGFSGVAALPPRRYWEIPDLYRLRGLHHHNHGCAEKGKRMKFEYLRGFSKKEKVDFTLSFLMVVVICALCAYMAMVFAL